MSEVQELIQSAIPKVNIDLQKNIDAFLKIIANPGECRSCHAPVWWITTKNNKPAPINRDLTSHFANCPSARLWRKNREEAGK